MTIDDKTAFPQDLVVPVNESEADIAPLLNWANLLKTHDYNSAYGADMTNASGRSASQSSVHNAVATHAITALVCGGAWWALLGWDTEKTAAPDGDLHEPYDGRQVGALVAIFGLLAVWLGHRSRLVGAPATAAIVLAACFAISAQIDPENEGLWPVGAIFVATASFIGIALAARASRLVEDRIVEPR